MAKNFLFEIGTEEIPARFMTGALKELKDKAEALFKEERIVYSEIKTYGTPRRLTMYVQDLQEITEGLVEEKKGPSVKVAFDDQGNYTKAAHGFAKGQKIAVEDLVIKKTAGGEYVYAVIEKKGENIRNIFPKLLSDLVLGLEFPKPMRWGNLDIKFIRPIRWLVSLYGEEIIPVEIEGIQAGRITQGHRFLGARQVEISDASSYFQKLEEEYVIVDQNKRQELIWQQIEELADAEGGVVKPNPELLEEINYLVEYPTALCGNFAPSYLELPKEALITVMREHQKYFPVWDKQGSLMPKFITVRNGNSKYLDIVASGNEKVLEARLNDGKFFLEEDMKTSLEERVEQLKSVIFQESLGTMYQKIERNKNLTSYLADILNLSPKAEQNALRAAFLSKADLVSHMVYEFPELQGIMGYYYALHDHEEKDVAIGIREHYQPRFAGDDLPASTVGTVTAIADKMDTIAGCFAAGIRPSGSGDPYGLRRQAQGICLMIVEGSMDINIFDLIDEALDNFTQQGLKFDNVEVRESIQEFFKQRLANLLEEKDTGYDVIQCVLESDWSNMKETAAKAQALTKFKDNVHYSELITSYTRAKNLAKNANTDQVDENIFKEEAEGKLWQQFSNMQISCKNLWDNEEYIEILEEFSSLKPYIDDYFENVMVMDKDETVKNNRLATLKNIVDYLNPFGDLSKLLQ